MGLNGYKFLLRGQHRISIGVKWTAVSLRLLVIRSYLPRF